MGTILIKKYKNKKTKKIKIKKQQQANK